MVIYATITGNDPVGLSHSTSLSNGLVLELQQAAAATVFNETSHLDYPWQTTSSNQNPLGFNPIPDPSNNTRLKETFSGGTTNSGSAQEYPDSYIHEYESGKSGAFSSEPYLMINGNVQPISLS